METYLLSEKVDTITYINDDAGNLVLELWQYGETVNKDGEVSKPDYTTKTIAYTYNDYYIFN